MTVSYKLLNKLRSPDLMAVFTEMASADSVPKLASFAKATAKQICGADAACLMSLNGDVVYHYDESSISSLFKEHRFLRGDQSQFWTLGDKEMMLVEDVTKDPRVNADLYKTSHVRSFCVIPLISRIRLGAIAMYWKEAYRPDEEELVALRSLARFTAVILQNLRSKAESEELLLEKSRLVDQLNQELNSFSEAVSHQLRAPLRGISGFLEIMLDEHGFKLDEEQKELAEKVQNNARYMTELVDNLQNYFKIGQKELLITELPMKLLVQEVLEEFSSLIRCKNLIVELGELPSARGDNLLIRQVLLQLISNAIKFSSRKFVRVIEVGSTLHDGHSVFFVKDNGAGFDPAYSHKLFNVFQRLHSQREFEGTGMGLAIVAKIVSRHGGAFWAEGLPGEGATFYFTLE